MSGSIFTLRAFKATGERGNHVNLIRNNYEYLSTFKLYKWFIIIYVCSVYIITRFTIIITK